MPLPHASPVSRRLIPLLVAVILSAFLVQTTRSAASAAPGDPVGCGYGTGGQNASTICWLDMTSYDDTQARTADGQNMTATLPGDYKISYTIKARPVGTQPFRADRCPRHAHRGPLRVRRRRLQEHPREAVALQPPGGTTLDVQLSNIKVTDSANVALDSFSFVAADTEDNVARRELPVDLRQAAGPARDLVPERDRRLPGSTSRGSAPCRSRATAPGARPSAGSANGRHGVRRRAVLVRGSLADLRASPASPSVSVRRPSRSRSRSSAAMTAPTPSMSP